MRSCGPARSSSSTWRLRRFGAGWPRASSSPRSGWMRRCRAISASRTSPPCGSSRSCGWMTLFPIRSRRSWPPAVSASPCRLRSSSSAWRGPPPTNGSSATPPISPGCPMPGSQGVHVRDIDNLGRPPKARLEQDRRLLGELRRDIGRGQGRRHCFRADPGRTPGRRLPAGDRIAPPLALVASADRVDGGGPGAPRGWRPARPGRERRAAGQDQRRVAPPRNDASQRRRALTRPGFGGHDEGLVW